MYHGGYELKVAIPSLEDASKLMKILAENGFNDVSMIRLDEDQSHSQHHSEWARASSAFGRFNELILASLYKAGARSETKSVTIEQIIQSLKEIRGGREILESKGEGIVSRTVSMVASAVLGNKYGWVSYKDTEPRRYWLTEKGLEHTGIISDGEEELVEQKA